MGVASEMNDQRQADGQGRIDGQQRKGKSNSEQQRSGESLPSKGEQQHRIDDQQSVERVLSEQLTEGHWNAEDVTDAARAHLSPKYEIRIQAKLDPIVEQTKHYRSIAQEIDDRYDTYMQRTVSTNNQEDDEATSRFDEGDGNDQ